MADWMTRYPALREMYNIIKAAEAGKSGNPNDYRDFVLPAYDCVRTGSEPPCVSK